tara:strand:- start:8 stop:352 length:345 start_codon:yes stop_codon:yes gene_type:complete
MPDVTVGDETEIESKKYPPNLKGGKRPWPSPWHHRPKVGEGVTPKTFGLESRHVEWLQGQPSQSEYIRALLDDDIMKRSLPEDSSQAVENITRAVTSTLKIALMKELREEESEA